MVKDHQLILRDTQSEELIQIYEMEQGEAQKFIIPYTLEQHQQELQNPDVVYKSIWRNKELVGFLILVLDPDGQSVEFRRIVISQPGQGYGKQVVRMVDHICRNELGRDRVWLDVFETNEPSMYITNVVISRSGNLSLKEKLFFCMKRRYNQQINGRQPRPCSADF